MDQNDLRLLELAKDLMVAAKVPPDLSNPERIKKTAKKIVSLAKEIKTQYEQQ